MVNGMSFSPFFAIKLSDYGNPKSLGARLRAKRIAPLLRMIETAYDKYGRVDIIDVGGTREYWGIVPRSFLEARNVKITLANLPGTVLEEDDALFRAVEVDGCDLTRFGDGAFHIAHSNSVVEHVGDWPRMVAFANEITRISQKYYIQTPNFWFPVEPHCMTPLFHWLPKPLRIKLVLRFALGHWPKVNSIDEAVRLVEHARLLDKHMFQALFKEATITTEWFFGMPKSLIATYG